MRAKMPPVTPKSFFGKGSLPGLLKDTWLVDDDAKGMIRGMLKILETQLAKSAKPAVGVDLETTGLDPQMKPARTRIISICAEETVAVFDVWKIGSGVRRVIDFLANPGIVKIFHNAKFDLKFLMHDLGCPDLFPLFDTQIAAQLVDLGDRFGKHDLGYCAEHYLKVHLRKDTGRKQWSDSTFPPHKIAYAANDAAVLPPLRATLMEIGREHGLLRAYKLEFEAVLPTARMELNGFKPDRRRWSEVTARAKVKMLDAQEKILELLPPVKNDTLPLFAGTPHFNLGSNDELKERLEAAGVDLPRLASEDDFLEPAPGVERAKGKTTLMSDKMAQVADTHELIPLVIEYSQHRKSVTSYGKKILRFVNPYDLRFHADFRQIGTVTTRYSVKEPPLHGIPKRGEHRECFVAEPGWKLVWADYSQIELRILAELSGDRNMLKAFLEGLDLHTQTASLLWGIDYALVQEIQRRRAKDLNFGIPYGVGPTRFAERAGITISEAKKIMGDHARKYPQENEYLKNAAHSAVVNGYCETLSGKMMHFAFDRSDQKQVAAVERHGKNYPIQGSSADITKTALRLVHDNTDGEVAKIVNCVHDEIVMEIREDRVDDQAVVLRQAMVEAGEQFLKTVPVVVDVEVNDYWKKKAA
jgi:DNA polymerase I